MEKLFLTSELRSTKDIWFSVLNGFAQAYPGMSNFTQSYKKALDFLSVDLWWKLFKVKSESIKIFSWYLLFPGPSAPHPNFLFKKILFCFRTIDLLMNCFCGMVDQRKAFTPYFQPGPLSEILTIANLWHAARRIWTCGLCSSDNHYTAAPMFLNL